MAKKVLFVDDSPTITSAAYDMLDELGYEVDLAYNGKEALDRVQQSKPDIIILDIEMPKLKGYEVAEVVRNIPELKKIPLIALTSVSPESLKEKARLFDAYLIKPFGFDQMLKIIVSKIGKP
jgi:CheY-like chemotaxis protein